MYTYLQPIINLHSWWANDYYTSKKHTLICILILTLLTDIRWDGQCCSKSRWTNTNITGCKSSQWHQRSVSCGWKAKVKALSAFYCCYNMNYQKGLESLYSFLEYAILDQKPKMSSSLSVPITYLHNIHTSIDILRRQINRFIVIYIQVF